MIFSWIRIGVVFFILLFFLYAYINQQNAIVDLRLQIPQIEKELARCNQENTELQFKIDQFENPAALIKLWQKPQWRHLKQPFEDEIITFEVEG